MSSHSYRTTTVEYYEYFMPDSHGYNYETMSWPVQATISTYIAPHPLDCINCLTGLHELLVMPQNNHRMHSHIIYGMIPCPPPARRTIYEFSEPEEPLLPNSGQPEQEAMEQEQDEEDHKTARVEARTSSEPNNKKKNHVYQAEQGYLVEEPSSESEEDPEGTP